MKLNRLAVLVVVLLALPAPATAVTIFADGFESGSTCAWGGGCPAVALINTSAVAPVSGHEEWGDFVVQFTVRAGLADLYFEKEGARSASPNLTKGFWFSIENSSGVTYTSGITPFSMSGSCPFPEPCNDTPTHFRVVAGTTRTFWMNVRLDNAGGTAGSYRTRLAGLVYKFDGNPGDGVVLVASGLTGFITQPVFVDNQDVANRGVEATSYDDFHRTLAARGGHL